MFCRAKWSRFSICGLFTNSTAITGGCCRCKIVQKKHLQKNEDIHSKTARTIFQIPDDQPVPKDLSQGKDAEFFQLFMEFHLLVWQISWVFPEPKRS